MRSSTPKVANVWNWLEQRELKRVSRRISGYGPGQLPAPDQPAGTDLLPQIKHIVVLMMENHSYDNYLGMLPGRGEGFPLGPDGEPEVSNTGAQGESVPAHHLDSTVQVAETPSQSWHATHLQWADGKLDGFVTATQELMPEKDATRAMGYWTERDLPFYYGLARTFPLADRWFSSCLGPTFPNRRFLISGTANGLIDDLPMTWPTTRRTGPIFDQLRQYGVSWVNYHPCPGKTGFRLGAAASAPDGRAPASPAAGAEPDLTGPVGQGHAVHDRHLPARHCAAPCGTCGAWSSFFTDADQGTLPAVSLVDPDFKDYSEENPQDIRNGEGFASEVIKRVMRGQGWASTLLIWLYDEHGGYYDHVPPPPAVEPDEVLGRSVFSRLHLARTRSGARCSRGYAKNAQKLDAGPRHYDRYGFRVPAVLVSPYARPGYVTSRTFDHTSVLKLIEQKWNLPPLTARDAAADSPLDALDLNSPPAFAEPPELPGPALRWGSWPAEV